MDQQTLIALEQLRHLISITVSAPNGAPQSLWSQDELAVLKNKIITLLTNSLNEE